MPGLNSGYVDYTVYPLEGIWDLSEDAKAKPINHLHKNELVFELMIRQPDFVSEEFAAEIIEKTKKKKPHELLSEVNFSTIEDSRCLQMMHIGSYDNETKSFNIMEDYCTENGLVRKSKKHREIYLSDFRKVPVEKLRTVLRFTINEK